MDEKAESQRGVVICSRPHSKTEAELDKELGYVVGATLDTVPYQSSGNENEGLCQSHGHKGQLDPSPGTSGSAQTLLSGPSYR